MNYTKMEPRMLKMHKRNKNILFVNVNPGVINEMWDSYDEMNSRIINIIDNK